MYTKVRVFFGRSNPELGKEINEILGYRHAGITIKNFSDGEIWMKYEENIRGADVFLVQPTNPPAENLLELLMMIDAAKRASAKRITAVIPYYGYARQDRKDQPRVPLSSRLFMDTIVTAGADRIVTMDLHSTQIQGFVNIPFDHLYAKPIFIDRLKELIEGKEYGIVVPDIGGVKFARSYAKLLALPFTIIDKRRPAPNEAEVMNVIGNDKVKHALIIDDMIDTGGTVVQTAELMKSRGCETITVVATHGLFSGPCIERFEKAPIDKIIVTNTINVPPEKRLDKIEIISAAPLLAQTINRIHNEESVSKLFEL